MNLQIYIIQQEFDSYRLSLRSVQTIRVVKQLLSLAHVRREEAHFWNLRCAKLPFVPLSQVTGENTQVPG